MKIEFSVGCELIEFIRNYEGRLVSHFNWVKNEFWVEIINPSGVKE